ncbi:catalase A [Niveomyces insectorum RCEF 264]|uniref:Catalase n=1 Tax=Niveomyces insectorum RCEF 264 TaxID=1081102 RepID=A0A167XAE4_9HYPO|nr:catalase A [Niveomyces insectorum RCEF 264]
MTSRDDKINDMKRNTVELTKEAKLTSDYGVRQGNNDNWLRIVDKDHTGPSLLEDPYSREKIHRFDHERIPERVVHARGVGAFGTFRVLDSLGDLTKAAVLTDTSRETPIFVRFSTVLGSRGSADTVRDVRGFAIKFYTAEGNWDLVGNNIPVFFIQDAIKFPDVIHAGKPEPHNEVPQAQTAHNNFWDFMYMHPEATHMFMWAMSDRAIPRSLRMMQGFGVNTFTLINAAGRRCFVKFHYTPVLGVHSLVWDEALKIAGQDPDFHRKDLAEAIANGVFPRWKFGVQVVPEEDEHKFEFDILDATKVWPEDQVPVRYFAEFELNRNVDEFFPQTEQAAFCTSHIVPGIGHSDDPLLQGRNFSYFDTQISRLGINWEELPINRPVCPVLNFNRDGAMRHTLRPGTVNYWPNRYDAQAPATAEEGAYVEYAQKVAGIKARTLSPKFREHIRQAQLFYNSLTPIEKKHLTSALAFELDHCDDPVVYTRVVQRLAEIDGDLAQTTAAMVGGGGDDGDEGSGSGGLAQKVVGAVRSGIGSAAEGSTSATAHTAAAGTVGHSHGMEPGEGPGGHGVGADPAALKKANYGKNHGKTAPGLSQFDFPPDAPTIASRRVAILIGDGFDTAAFDAVKLGLAAEKAVPVIVGTKRRPILGAGASQPTQPDHHVEGFRSTMVDAVFVPGGQASIAALTQPHSKGRVVHWLREAFGHLKALGATGEGVGLLQEALAGVPRLQLSASGGSIGQSYGVVTTQKASKEFTKAFFHSIAQHRNFDRELDGLNTLVAY